ncbi:Alpha/Beta hydrolase protein [Mycena sp. CBHHK59/15]|nr:Alpha/Beta hydrolase protein [Mycena sp. CBHHK59/15]
MPITPQDVANAEQISGITLSDAADLVVYCVGPSFHAKGEHKTNALWLAKTDSGDIFFLSDRHKAGGAAQIYRLSSSAFGGDAIPVTPIANTKGVSSFSISRNGHWLAYISPDEPEQKDEEDAESHVIMWRNAKDLGRLRILDLSGQIKEACTVVAVDSHVESFTWSPDSTRILYRLTELPDLESHYFPVSKELISVEPGDSGDSFRKSNLVVKHPSLPNSDSVWADQEKFYFIRADDTSSSPVLWACEPTSGASPTRIAFGHTDDAEALISVGAAAAVEVACGLETRIDIVDPDSDLPFTTLETCNDAFHEWDIKQVDGKHIIVVLRSLGVTGEAENLWCGSTKKGTKGVLSTKLSSHHEWTSKKEMPQCAPFYWSIEDGTSLQGIIAHPRGQKLESLPTVVVPHGGPYYRDVVHMRINVNYRYLLASHGLLVLCPNYHGSQGRGTRFAKAAKGGMGTLDYADVESMIAVAIERGQGGFLSAWGCTRPNSVWKAGVIGAGPTDWGSLIICSDVPDMEADLGGTAPCPIRDVKNVKAPLLIVHGENDERVPLTQAIGFMRGLVREADKAVSDASSLVIYPREGHPFQERAHVVDQLERVLEHLEKYLK